MAKKKRQQAERLTDRELKREINEFNFTRDEVIQHLQKRHTLPKLPMIWLSFALLKDGVDFLDLTLLGIIVTTIASAIFSVALFIWMTYKIGFVQKRLFKMAARWIALALVGIIPFLKMVPETMILVLLIHYEHTKIVRGIIGITGQLQNTLQKHGLSIEDVLSPQEKRKL